jgi:hypothetical protein
MNPTSGDLGTLIRREALGVAASGSGRRSGEDGGSRSLPLWLATVDWGHDGYG